MSDFHKFAVAINKRYNEMARGEVYCVDISKDELWEAYLKAFPEGTNPIYIINTEHDCSCCRQFVKGIGAAVTLGNSDLNTVWGVEGLDSPYKEVAEALDQLVRSKPLLTVLRHTEPQYGTEQNTQGLPNGRTIIWKHFWARPPQKFLATKSKSVEQMQGDFNTALAVYKRGLEEITDSAIQDVLDLISSNSLYRGEEHKAAVLSFNTLKTGYETQIGRSQEMFLFETCEAPGARIKNTVIGTLLVDLSQGVELETAVKSFEQKVAPMNYKRPTALITPRMVEDAMKTIETQGLGDAIQRRLAKFSDVSVNNVLWVDNAVKPVMKDGLKDVLMSVAKATPKLQKAQDISIDEFMSKVLPGAQSVDMFVRSEHLGNFMTLTAPAIASDAKLFKWDNQFAWSYDGDITDTIKEKVKKAGGNIDAKLRFSLAWFNFDDLDIHVIEPGGNHIHFSNKSGKLDVDMNAGGGTTREPVENVSFVSPRDGDYKVCINQWAKRETKDFGFVVEIAHAGGTTQHRYSKAIASGNDVQVGVFTVKAGVIVKAVFADGIVGGGISSEKWGVKTEELRKVQTVMFSPNYWDDNAVGNKHWFFILEGCKTPESVRGIYNEFLSPGLEKHRKVFEIIGAKTKCEPTVDQLSGLGFSSTRGDTVTVVVTADKSQQTFNIKF